MAADTQDIADGITHGPGGAFCPGGGRLGAGRGGRVGRQTRAYVATLFSLVSSFISDDSEKKILL